MTKIYSGRRTVDGCTVAVDQRPLRPRDGARAVESGEFEWGYSGSGPTRLALSILADHFDDDAIAQAHHKSFGEAVIANIRGDAWTLSSDEIDLALGAAFDVPMTLEEVLEKARRASA